jgi:hypothetical protein
MNHENLIFSPATPSYFKTGGQVGRQRLEIVGALGHARRNAKFAILEHIPPTDARVRGPRRAQRKRLWVQKRIISLVLVGFA